MRRKRKRAFVIVVVILAIWIISFFKTERTSLYKAFETLACDDNHGKEILHRMCILYKNGRAAGNLCEDFCKNGLLTIDKCLSHKDDNVIYSAKWRGKNIFVKAKKRSKHADWIDVFPESLNQNDTELRATFMDVMYEHVLLKLVHYKNFKTHRLRKLISPNQLLSKLYFNITPDQLERKEMQSLWFLLQQEEFYLFQLLQDFRHIPRVYGSCWQFYALEEVQTLDVYGGIKEFLITKSFPWRTRVKLMLELLSLVQELDTKTIYGTWQHCDIQPGNLGVTQDGVVKMIDVDLLYTDEKMQEILRQESSNCSSSSDCEFFDCASQCDMKTKTCLSKRISNNLKVICRDLFAPKWLGTGLMANVPGRSSNKFDDILKECLTEPHNRWTKKTYQRLYTTLITLLRKELV